MPPKCRLLNKSKKSKRDRDWVHAPLNPRFQSRHSSPEISPESRLSRPPRNCPYQCSQPTSTNAIFDAEEACAMLRIGRGAMYQLAKDHDDPFPIKFSRAPRLESSLTFHALE